jgi:hypothetical protein
MELIKFDKEYINTRYIISIHEPRKTDSDSWEIMIITAGNKYPCYTWNFSSQFEAEQEYKKLVDNFANFVV